MPPKHIVDRKNQGSLLPPPGPAIRAGLFKASEGGVYYPEQPSDKAARLISLLDSLNDIMVLNSSEGMEKGAHVSDIREDMVERLGSGDKLGATLEDKEANKPWRENRARERFEYATGHDKRLKRMSPEAAEKITDRAFKNFKVKYAAPNDPESSKNRRRLRSKANRLITKL